MFLANYGDGLSDLNLPVMIDELRKSNAVGSLLLVQPTASFDIVGSVCRRQGRSRSRPEPSRTSGSTAASSCFATRSSDYINPGDELVRQPFQRLIEKGALLGSQMHRVLAVHGHVQGQATP